MKSLDLPNEPEQKTKVKATFFRKHPALDGS